ncbi:cache domain-containing protein [Azospirillum sp. B4]|uniref:cache domain-containing protein n=1 Tax=Azospirillum sp. B4 TaxID=95605 RepID=UPI0011DDF2C3|nr:cache domain-containing protein [Azospirillum sp. B4]
MPIKQGVIGVVGFERWAIRAPAGLVTLGVLLFLSLLTALYAVMDRTDTAVATARDMAAHDLGILYESARDQSAAYSSTSFIGYSVGRYYGFASAFAQISPNPERAAALLRTAFAQGDAQQQGASSALAPYMAVHDRFHASFVDMIGSSVFNDLYLIDRLGRVVYSLRKDSAFGQDLNDARTRDTPLGEVFREIMARLQKADDPTQVLVVTPPKELDGATAGDGPEGVGMLVARPVVRHGSVEGVVAFRLPLATVDRRLGTLARPGIGFALMDADGRPADQPVASRGLSPRGIYGVSGSPWQFQVLASGWALSGWLGWWTWGLALASAAGGGWTWRQARRQAPSMIAAPPVVPAAPPVPAAPAVFLAPAPVPVMAPPVLEPVVEAPPPVVPLEGEPANDLDANEEFRRCIVDVMTLALDFWHHSKRKGKIELAEESGLWRVYMDRSSLQTRTLDKYLLVETLPRNPRWRDVVRTAEFVLRHCPENGAEREGVREALGRLKQHLRHAERI